jgi:hypothetical protein
MVIAIVDKTSFNDKGLERISLDWILNNEKFSKTRQKTYDRKKDFYGFLPDSNGQYQLRGLENLSRKQLEYLSTICDVTYFTDTYGIDEDHVAPIDQSNKSSAKTVGGMSEQELDFLQMMKNKGKLILSEFNDIGSPTSAPVRERFESLFGIHWTGWAVKYFDNLDTAKNKGLPTWLPKDYMRQHDNEWPFKHSGIVLINQTGQVEILDNDKELNYPTPRIRTFQYGQEKFNLPHFTNYPYWIDIITFNDTINHAVSAYEIRANEQGNKKLQQLGIPNRFPAVIMHNGTDYKFYYFCGDYSDNPISYFTSYFKGVTTVDWLFYDVSKLDDRTSFFWRFYRPLVSNILNDYYHQIKAGKTSYK